MYNQKTHADVRIPYVAVVGETGLLERQECSSPCHGEGHGFKSHIARLWRIGQVVKTPVFRTGIESSTLSCAIIHYYFLFYLFCLYLKTIIIGKEAYGHA